MKQLLTILLLAISSLVAAQDAFNPQLISVGVTKQQMLDQLKDQKLQFEHPKGPAKYDGSYVLTTEERIKQEMFTVRYEYVINHDSVVTVKIKPATWNNWQEYLSRGFELIDTKKQETRVVYCYKPLHADYYLYVVKNNHQDKPEKIQVYYKPIIL